MAESPSPGAFYRDMKPASRPIWREVFVGLEWMALRAAPVYYGLGVPRGDGSAVVVVPGFLGTDFYLQEMYHWLRRIGYRAYQSEIGWNADCLDVMAARLAKTVEKASKETGRRVHLIGHSLGGVLSRSVAIQKPQQVATVIALGSPIRGVRSHPLVMATAERVRERIRGTRHHENKPDCYTGYCDCRAVEALQDICPALTKQYAIYTKTDGIVDWKFCINDDPSTNFEVQGTHIGLAFNHDVYRLISKLLA